MTSEARPAPPVFLFSNFTAQPARTCASRLRRGARAAAGSNCAAFPRYLGKYAEIPAKFAQIQHNVIPIPGFLSRENCDAILTNIRKGSMLGVQKLRNKLVKYFNRSGQHPSPFLQQTYDLTGGANDERFPIP